MTAVPFAGHFRTGVFIPEVQSWAIFDVYYRSQSSRSLVWDFSWYCLPRASASAYGEGVAGSAEGSAEEGSAEGWAVVGLEAWVARAARSAFKGAPAASAAPFPQ
jgi:hypothetical protein